MHSHLLQMEVTTSSEQPKLTSPNDTKAILKHVSCFTKTLFLPLVNTYMIQLIGVGTCSKVRGY